MNPAKKLYNLLQEEQGLKIYQLRRKDLSDVCDFFVGKDIIERINGTIRLSVYRISDIVKAQLEEIYGNHDTDN